MQINNTAEPLIKARQSTKEWLSLHPTALKATLIVNHLLRTIPIYCMMALLPFSLPINFALCAAGSLFYTLTIEGNCIYKFTLPSLFGAAAWRLAPISLIPLTLWTAYIIHTSIQDVQNTSCCCLISR